MNHIELLYESSPFYGVLITFCWFLSLAFLLHRTTSFFGRKRRLSLLDQHAAGIVACLERGDEQSAHYHAQHPCVKAALHVVLKVKNTGSNGAIAIAIKERIIDAARELFFEPARRRDRVVSSIIQALVFAGPLIGLGGTVSGLMGAISLLSSGSIDQATLSEFDLQTSKSFLTTLFMLPPTVLCGIVALVLDPRLIHQREDKKFEQTLSRFLQCLNKRREEVKNEKKTRPETRDHKERNNARELLVCHGGRGAVPGNNIPRSVTIVDHHGSPISTSTIGQASRSSSSS